MVLLLVCACDQLASSRMKKGSRVEKDNSIVTVTLTVGWHEFLVPAVTAKDKVLNLSNLLFDFVYKRPQSASVSELLCPSNLNKDENPV